MFSGTIFPGICRLTSRQKSEAASALEKFLSDTRIDGSVEILRSEVGVAIGVGVFVERQRMVWADDREQVILWGLSVTETGQDIDTCD